MKFSCISKILISHFLSLLYCMYLLFVYTKQDIYMYNFVLFFAE